LNILRANRQSSRTTHSSSPTGGENSFFRSLLTEALYSRRSGRPKPDASRSCDGFGNLPDRVRAALAESGHFTSLIQKRLAGVLAWWVPGSRDVINGMEVVPLQEDSDEEIAKAVRLVLEKDPFVNAERIRVT